MDFQSGQPIYLQVIDALREQMITGALRPGDKLPSSRELSQRYQINPNTAARVYREMDALGLSFTRRGIGTFVTEEAETMERLREARTRQLMEEFVEKMRRIGCAPEQLPALLEQFLKGGDADASGV